MRWCRTFFGTMWVKAWQEPKSSIQCQMCCKPHFAQVNFTVVCGLKIIGPAYVHFVVLLACVMVVSQTGPPCNLRGSPTWRRGSGQKVEVGRGKLQGRREVQAEITNHCLSIGCRERPQVATFKYGHKLIYMGRGSISRLQGTQFYTKQGERVCPHPNFPLKEGDRTRGLLPLDPKPGPPFLAKNHMIPPPTRTHEPAQNPNHSLGTATATNPPRALTRQT